MADDTYKDSGVKSISVFDGVSTINSVESFFKTNDTSNKDAFEFEDIKDQYDATLYETYFDQTSVRVYYCDVNIPITLFSYEIVDTSSPVFSHDSEIFNMITGGTNYIQGSVLIPTNTETMDILYRITLKRIEAIVDAIFTEPKNGISDLSLTKLAEYYSKPNSISSNKDNPADVLSILMEFFLNIADVKSVNTGGGNLDLIKIATGFLESIKNSSKYNKEAIKLRIINAAMISYEHNGLVRKVKSFAYDDQMVTIKYLGYKNALREFNKIFTEIYNKFMSYTDLNITNEANTSKTESTHSELYQAYIRNIYDKFTLDLVFKARYGPKETRGADEKGEMLDPDIIDKNRPKHGINETFIGVVFNKVGLQIQTDGRPLYYAYNFISKNNIYDDPRDILDFDRVSQILVSDSAEDTISNPSFGDSEIVPFNHKYDYSRKYLLYTDEAKYQ
jgi:hypothetical protein